MPSIDLTQIARSRYTTKAFNPDKRVPEPIIDELLSVLRFSPSSVNSQPWHFVVANTAEGRQRVAEGVKEGFAYNAPKVMQASHVIVFCTRTSMSTQHLDGLLAQEEADGRFQVEGAKAGQQTTRLNYVNLHLFDQKDVQHWMEKQTYLALGTLLLAAATLGVDATPMEGFDPRRLDVELGLRARGLTSVVLVALGYRSDADFNAGMPKSRLPEDAVYTYL